MKTANVPAIPPFRSEPARRHHTSKFMAFGMAGIIVALAGCSSAPAAQSMPETTAAVETSAATSADRLALGTKATYPGAPTGTLPDAPDGFEPVLVEHVARHGSRMLSSKKYDDLIIQLWELAKADDALTETGMKLGPVVEEITKAHEKLGYGSLSGLGEREHQEMAERTYQRMAATFDAAAIEGKEVRVSTSGVDRAIDSAQNFVAGLEKAKPELAPMILEPATDKDLLYFHDTDEAYNGYLEEDETLAQTIEKIESDPAIESTANHVLQRLFTPEFIKVLDSGEIDLVDRGDGDKHLSSVVDAAMYLYELYVIAPGMADEHKIDFSDFVSAEDALVLARVSEAEDFYEKGPAFEGSDVTYSMAKVLLQEMLGAVEGVRNGETTQAADFRFAHAEEIIPLAALMQLPGSTKQQSPATLFSYETNEWRGAEVAPMGSNIQWDVHANESQDVIVRMLYNEKAIPFGFDCSPVEPGSLFYRDTELKRCLEPVAG